MTTTSRYLPGQQMIWQEWEGRGSSPELVECMRYGVHYNYWKQPETRKSPLKDLSKVNGPSMYRTAHSAEDEETLPPEGAAVTEFRRVTKENFKWEGPMPYTSEVVTGLHFVVRIKEDGKKKWRIVVDCKASLQNEAC